ncbi:MAG TPA: WecB/TagA/CpsF family glycosyltransferase [Baekduia sp.]|nr:WecB/TagA/CpsF family glycosyltransferase [Baekduia sp.]
MGLDFAATTESEVVALFVDRAAAGLGSWVVTANLDHLRRFAAEPATRELIAEADVVVADGMPVVVASRVAGMPLPERIAGSSMILPIGRRAAQRGASVFLIGGEPGVADRACERMVDAAPGLRVAGTHCPPHGFEHDEDELRTIERLLVDAAPDIVLLALSFPKTDNLIRRLRPLLPGASFMGVGIALSFLAGDRRRAPTWMRRAGVEWLHRLVSEPRRLWRRYLVDGLPFAARLTAAAAVARVQRTLGGPWFSHPVPDVPTIGAPRA